MTSTVTAPAEMLAALEHFLATSGFYQRGSIITDLDGTAVHEHDGRAVIAQRVELALSALAELGCPLMLNTLRFPLSVLRTFGREWYRITSAPLPVVTLNGGLLGRIVEAQTGELAFEELAAQPLDELALERALGPVDVLFADGVRDVLVFYYPRDWRRGELIWTPDPEKVPELEQRYASASQVTAMEYPRLRERILAAESCMVFLLVDLPGDRLMAYQHAQGSHFFTRAGVDKLSGAHQMSRALATELGASLGAGDTEMDRFLAGVGCAVIVGNLEVSHRGLHHTLRVRDSASLGELLLWIAELRSSNT